MCINLAWISRLYETEIPIFVAVYRYLDEKPLKTARCNVTRMVHDTRPTQLWFLTSYAVLMMGFVTLVLRIFGMFDISFK